MFKAKSKISIAQLDLLDIPHDDGYVTGYYLNGHMVGKAIDTTNRGIGVEWGVEIDKDTLVEMICL